MKNSIRDSIINSTSATGLKEIEKLQDLWSGYGTIKRYKLLGHEKKNIIVKHVCIPENSSHPRGWSSKFSHKRKLKSYRVEMAWYRTWSSYLDEQTYVPKCLFLDSDEDIDYFLIVLEDLDNVGYPIKKVSIKIREMKTCLKWLARFHATFLGSFPDGLWQTGTYWHLETRPEELHALKDKDLKSTAHLIDEKLKNSPFQTIVHGDAKLANFCFSEDGKKVAAVDFQYVGGGCGMKDVAYFIGSCLDESNSEKYETELLDYYFDVLGNIAQSKHRRIDTKALVENWRELYPVAWADFHRFIKGWSPGHWKINSYSEKMTKNVIESLNSKKPRA